MRMVQVGLRVRPTCSVDWQRSGRDSRSILLSGAGRGDEEQAAAAVVVEEGAGGWERRVGPWLGAEGAEEGEDEGAAEGGVEAEEEVVVGAAGADRIRLVDFLPNPLGLSRHLS